jgi:tetratricopeptide (TPR) repeat protein
MKRGGRRVLVLLFSIEALFVLPAQAQPSPQQMIEGVDPKIVKELESWSRELDKNPKDFNALSQRGFLSMKASHQSRYRVFWIQKGSKDLEEAIKLNPNDFYVRHNYAQAAFEAGDWSEDQPVMRLAVTQFTKAIELNPKSARSYMGRGFAYQMLNDQANAEKDFTKTLELDPSLRGDLQKGANGIAQKKKQVVAAKEMMKRLGRYRVVPGVRTAQECARYKAYWTQGECRESMAMNPAP